MVGYARLRRTSRGIGTWSYITIKPIQYHFKFVEGNFQMENEKLCSEVQELYFLFGNETPELIWPRFGHLTWQPTSFPLTLRLSYPSI